MKNLVRTIAPLIIGAAIGFFVCKEYFCEKCPDCPDCPPNTSACAPTSETPGGIISVNDAINLHENYVGDHYTAINNAMGDDFLDTQFVWFEYDRIKQYISYLEAVQQKNPNNDRISGIRIYFGAHNASNDEYPRQQTVFLTPTVDAKLNDNNSNMNNLPFFIKPTNASDPLVGQYKVIARLLIDQYLNPDERAFLANNNLANRKSQEAKGNTTQKSANAAENDDDDDKTSLSFNMGQLSPPPRN
ncbi:hypothetical protein [uncultured Kordia sp.]|uniref:hypothetical protein n=1 Tax=uncultured Kordia sp. TaxID=507699 RepID=UPI00262A5F5E|nr:hypothetical protein [uncultured Kordia sp.]